MGEYFMPANADACVIAWRTWFARYGRGAPTCAATDAMPPLMSKEQVRGRG